MQIVSIPGLSSDVKIANNVSNKTEFTMEETNHDMTERDTQRIDRSMGN